MRGAVIGLLGIWMWGVGACGPSYEPRGVKSASDLLDERYGDDSSEASESDEDTSDFTEETDEDKNLKFNLKKSEIALKQARRSAEDCTGVVDEEFERGTATVNITFNPNGHVDKATIDYPYTDTKIGQCVLNAMGNVVVPPFTGDPVDVSWPINLDGDAQGGKGGKGGK